MPIIDVELVRDGPMPPGLAQQLPEELGEVVAAWCGSQPAYANSLSPTAWS